MGLETKVDEMDILVSSSLLEKRCLYTKEKRKPRVQDARSNAARTKLHNVDDKLTRIEKLCCGLHSQSYSYVAKSYKSSGSSVMLIYKPAQSVSRSPSSKSKISTLQRVGMIRSLVLVNVHTYPSFLLGKQFIVNIFFYCK